MAQDGDSQITFPRESPLDREYSLESRIKLPRLGDVLVFRNPDGLRIMAKEKIQSSVEECKRDILQAVERMKLNHPHLLQMLDYSATQAADGKFVVRGYYELAARNLTAELDQRKKEGRPMMAEELRNLLIDILEIMAALKESKMIHGDIRPEYIIFDPETEVYKLADRLGDPSPPTLVQSKNIQKQKKLYLSPQLFYNLSNQHRSSTQGRANPAFEPLKLNPYLSEGYSLGLVVLESALLDDIQGIYNLNSGKINEAVLDQKIADFAERYEEKDVGLVRAVQDLLEISEEERPDLHLLLTGLKSTPQNSEYGDEEDGDYIFKNEQQENSGPIDQDLNPAQVQMHQGMHQLHPNYGMMKTSHGVVIEEEDEEGSDTRQGVSNIFKEDQIQHLLLAKNMPQDIKIEQKGQSNRQSDVENSGVDKHRQGAEIERLKGQGSQISDSDELHPAKVLKVNEMLAQSTQQSSEAQAARYPDIRPEERPEKPSVPAIQIPPISGAMNATKSNHNQQSNSSLEWEHNLQSLKAQRDEMIASLQKLKEAGELAGFDVNLGKKEQLPTLKPADSPRGNIFKEEVPRPEPAQKTFDQRSAPMQNDQKPRDYNLHSNKSGLSSGRNQPESQTGGASVPTPETTIEPEYFKPAPQAKSNFEIPQNQPVHKNRSEFEKPPIKQPNDRTANDQIAQSTNQPQPRQGVQYNSHGGSQTYQLSNSSSLANQMNGFSSRREDWNAQHFQSSNMSSQAGLVQYSSKPGLYSTNLNYSSSTQIHANGMNPGNMEQTPSTQIKDLTPARSHDTSNLSTVQRSSGTFASRAQGDSSPKPAMLSHSSATPNAMNNYRTLGVEHPHDSEQNFSPQFTIPASQAPPKQPSMQRDDSRHQMTYTPTRGANDERYSGISTPVTYNHSIVHPRENGSSISPAPSIMRDHQGRDGRRDHTPDLHSSLSNSHLKLADAPSSNNLVQRSVIVPAASFDPATGQYTYPKPLNYKLPGQEDSYRQPASMRGHEINFSSHHQEIIRQEQQKHNIQPQGYMYPGNSQVRVPASTPVAHQSQGRYDSSSNIHQSRDVQATYISRDHSPYTSDANKGRVHHPLLVENAQSRREMQPIVIRSRSNTPLRGTLTGITAVAHTVGGDTSVDKSPTPVYRQSGSTLGEQACRVAPGGLAGEIQRSMASQKHSIISNQNSTSSHPGYIQNEASQRLGSYTQSGSMLPPVAQAPLTSYGYTPMQNYQPFQPNDQPRVPFNQHPSMNNGPTARPGYGQPAHVGYQHMSSTPSPIRTSGHLQDQLGNQAENMHRFAPQPNYNPNQVRYNPADGQFQRPNPNAFGGSDSTHMGNSHQQLRPVLGALSMNTAQNSQSNFYNSGSQLPPKASGGSGHGQQQYPQQVVRPPPDAKVIQYYTTSKTTVYENAPQSAGYRHPN